MRSTRRPREPPKLPPPGLAFEAMICLRVHAWTLGGSPVNTAPLCFHSGLSAHFLPLPKRLLGSAGNWVPGDGPGYQGTDPSTRGLALWESPGRGGEG